MKRNRTLLLWSLFLSALFIGLGSKSSPLYPMNDWVDVNCFFTVGRGIIDGLVPYRDLMEQKGPVLYFIYAFITLFSRDSFLGVYLMEVLTFSLFLYFSGKISRLYLGNSPVVYILQAVLAAAIVTSWSFTHGGSVEQHFLCILTYGMYSVLSAIQENRPLSWKEALLNGIFAGLILWIKYTTLGFYLGLALFVLIWYLTDPSLRTHLLKTIGQFLLGIGIVSAAVMVYFVANNAVNDLFTVYFYNNIFLYGADIQGSRLLSIWNCLKSAIKYNTNYGWLICSGFFWLLLRRDGHRKAALMTVLCFGGLCIGTYWGGLPYDYYGLVFAAFCIFGLIVWVDFLRSTRLFDLWNQMLLPRAVSVCAALSIVMCVLLIGTLEFNQNLYLTRFKKDDTVQYRFAQTIQTTENPSLLNYGFLDGGFYFASGATPACRYFCYLNIATSEMWQEQNACIANGEADFIVTRYYKLDQYAVDSSRYRLIDEYTHPFTENTTFTYYLYQRIS